MVRNDTHSDRAAAASPDHDLVALGDELQRHREGHVLPHGVTRVLAVDDGHRLGASVDAEGRVRLCVAGVWCVWREDINRCVSEGLSD